MIREQYAGKRPIVANLHKWKNKKIDEMDLYITKERWLKVMRKPISQFAYKSQSTSYVNEATI